MDEGLDRKTIEKMIEKLGAAKIAELMVDALGPDIAKMLNKYGVDGEETVRYMPLNAEIKQARNEKGLTIKDVSKTLKIPQYRLKAIEDGSFSQIEPKIFHFYTKFLGIEPYVKSWCENNTELAGKIGIREEDDSAGQQETDT